MSSVDVHWIKVNPLDDTARGLSASNQEKVKRWVRGLKFLWKDESNWVNQGDKQTLELNEHDPEVKVTVKANINKVPVNSTTDSKQIFIMVQNASSNDMGSTMDQDVQAKCE